MAGERRLICVPPDDAAFVAAVEEAFAALDRATLTDRDVAAVIDSLKKRYPAVRMRTRDPIADYLPDQVTWYVFRDGSPSGEPEGDRPAGRGR